MYDIPTNMNDVMGIEKLNRTIEDLWQKRDPRMEDLPLMDGPGTTVALCAAYVAFVCFVGPAVMKKREAFDLKWAMVVYNAVQIILCVALVYGCLKAGWAGDYSFTCQPVDFSDDPKAILMTRVTWLYFMTKFLEFLDTIFFVLRKKFNQVTFLHVSHHCLMPLYMWPNVRFLPGGHGSLGGLLNSFVHVFMYGYYLAAALCSKQNSKLRVWKKGITWLQLSQFAVIFIHDVQLLFRECDYPKSQAVVSLCMMVFFFVMFSNFYIKEYFEKAAKKQEAINGVSEKKKRK